MRQDIEFNAEGVTLRGWFYYPPNAQGPLPTVVMAHGFSAVKEMFLDSYAEAFAEAGLGVLVFDHRNFGASDGHPRQEIDPWAQVRDYRHAITYARTLPQVDKERLGVWGTSYSGGHAIVVGALDRRVRCVVSQVPLISGYRNRQRLVRADLLHQVEEVLEADRQARMAGNPPATIPVVAEDPLSTPCALPTRDSYEWFMLAAQRAPSWRNEVTLRSLELILEYEPGAFIQRVSPTPLLMIVAAYDHLAVADLALEAYNVALEPKKLLLVPGGHFDVYTTFFQQTAQAARDWFIEHLKGR